MLIKDLLTGKVREYGTNGHDALVISDDGKSLSYENLQNCETSFGSYRFVTENEVIPQDDMTYLRYGADAYFNIGGFRKEEHHD